MMRYVFVPYIQQIPQWKQCYYDYRLLQKVFVFIKECHQTYVQTTQKSPPANSNQQYQRTKQANNQSQKSLHNINLDVDTMVGDNMIIKQHSKQIYELMSKWCLQFSKYSYKCSSIVVYFVRMRYIQAFNKHEQYMKLYREARQEGERILLLLQNLYIQATYLSKALSFNQAQEIKMTSEYQKFSKKYDQHYKKFGQNKKIRRWRHIIQKLTNQIQSSYNLVNRQKLKSSQQTLQFIVDSKSGTTFREFKIIGAVMGTLVLMVTVLIITDDISNITLQQNTTFNEHFPIWRGASYVLLYLWLLGLDILFYQRSQINYKLVFQFKQHSMPQSKYIFLRAGVLSLIYIVLFYIFTLQLGGHIRSTFQHYGAIFWAILIFQLFATAPFKQSKSTKGKFYLSKMIYIVLCSPCIEINFLIIWVTQQFASFNQPFGDFFYTICYTINRNSPYCTTNSAFASIGYILFILLYRIIQNLRLWHQNTMRTPSKKYNFKAPPFIGAFRGLFAFITTIFALLNRLKVFQGIFYVWLVVSIITTIYSWFIDINNDFGILDFSSKNFLRKKLLFPRAKFLYYFIAIFDLVLRTAWILTISTLVIVEKGFPTLIFTMCLSYLEIIRRGIWNFLRVQFQHIRNCGEFRVTADDSDILNQVKQAVKIKHQEEALQRLNIKKKSQKQSPQDNNIYKLIEYIFIYCKQINQNKQKLDQIRQKETVQMFKNQLKRKGQMRQQILRQLKSDKLTLHKMRLKIKKNSCFNKLSLKIKQLIQ